jgi:hypothetical protein
LSGPLPPLDLATRTPEILVLDAGTIVERFFNLTHDPIYFDRGDLGRMNAPDGGYGVLYAAEGVRGAFAETFLRAPGRRSLSLDFIRKKGRARLRAVGALRLIKLAGFGLGKLGATAEVTHSGLPYDVSQRWSKALHDLAIQPDGVAYNSRHDDEALCYAIFERASLYIEEHSRETDIDQDWFWQIAERYGFALAPPNR